MNKKLVSFRANNDILEKIDIMALNLGTTRSGVINLILSRCFLSLSKDDIPDYSVLLRDDLLKEVIINGKE